MIERWVKKRVLITVRTYPAPSKQVVEASCTAGICEGKWIRLFPVPYRLLVADNKFKKYQYIEVDAIKAADPRPESYKINPDSIKILSDPLTTGDKWLLRKSIVLPLKSKSLCSLSAELDSGGHTTLGIFKPAKISGLKIAKSRTTWTEKQKESLLQSPMFDKLPSVPLQKLPFDFFYEFQCDDPNCHSHRMSCTDWEIGESYLRWSNQYGDNWEKKFRERYEADMIRKYDTHFYVGTVHGHPHEWIIIGLFCPPKSDNAIQTTFQLDASR